MRTTILTTVGLLGLAMMSPIPVAHAAGETCRGEAATLVGNPRGALTGTEGRDVVVTNGAANVSTLGGDDLICVTSGGDSSVKRVTILAGAGDDVVDGTTARDWTVQAELGEGADRFEGGDAGSFVHGANRDAVQADTERDVILGGAGKDVVTSGVVGSPNPDILVLGAGDDSLIHGGIATPGGSIDGGAGVDEFFPSTSHRSGATLIDNAAGRLVIDQQVVATWSGLETFWTSTRGGDDLEFVGTATDETVNAKVSGVVRAAFGAGDDRFRADQAPRAGSEIDGGDGRDLFYVTSEAGLLDLDLEKGELEADATSPYTIPATDFEDASLFADRVFIAGTGSRNDLTFAACAATVRGRRGADTIKPSYDDLYETVFCPRFPRAHLKGGRGRDDLQGTSGRDTLRGGKGTDVLDGHEGHDRLAGGKGPDELRGAKGNDVLRGGRGNDRLLGGKGLDNLRGERGNDRAYGGRDRDRADGGPGRRDLCRAERQQRCER